MYKQSQAFCRYITVLQVCLYAPRKCDKFPKVIINALIILHWLHCIPNPFSALLLQLGGGGGRGNNKPSAQIMTQAPQLGSRNGSHWQKPKAERGVRELPFPPCLPPSKPQLPWALTTKPALCSGNVWGIKGFSKLLFPRCFTIPCLFPNLYTLFILGHQG